MFPVADLRAYLGGGWRLDRAIDDRRAGTQGAFDGTASFHEADEGLRYAERGTLALPGYAGEAARQYLFAFAGDPEDPGGAEVRFAGGDFFHRLDLTRGAWTAVHPCGGDSYHGRFTAEGPDCWRSVWRVTGPAKDLVVESVYRRHTHHANVCE